MNTTNKVENLVKEVLNKNSSYLNTKQCYYTAYFWLKDFEKFTAIFAEDLDDFTNKIRVAATLYLETESSN